MKREHTINEYGVSRHFGLIFWQVCEFCHLEFRREDSYKWMFSNRGWHYSCGSCCASISHCNDQINYRKERARASMAGTAPPAPPMRTFRNNR